ncbi:Uncharacterised protein [uncultured archaeon]|nr:Uncharacterised protein [uncultured archaeon]
MKPLFDVSLRWFDDGTLLVEEPRQILEQFLLSLGVSAPVAADVLEVFVLARKADRALSLRAVMEGVAEIRRRRGAVEGKGLGERNIQVWLKWYVEIGLLEKSGRLYRFYANKLPADAFRESVKPNAERALAYVERAADKMQVAYGFEAGKSEPISSSDAADVKFS